MNNYCHVKRVIIIIIMAMEVIMTTIAITVSSKYMFIIFKKLIYIYAVLGIEMEILEPCSFLFIIWRIERRSELSPSSKST